MSSAAKATEIETNATSAMNTIALSNIAMHENLRGVRKFRIMHRRGAENAEIGVCCIVNSLIRTLRPLRSLR